MTTTIIKHITDTRHSAFKRGVDYGKGIAAEMEPDELAQYAEAARRCQAKGIEQTPFIQGRSIGVHAVLRSTRS